MNSIGTHFKVTSFGESHGSHVGCILEGCPSGLQLNFESIQTEVNKRKTAQNNFASQRKEPDIVEIVSGVFEGKTLGTPICLLIQNKDAQSADYDKLKEVFRPGHADFSYHQKYAHRDHRGGGRSSIRITAPLVAAGEIARQILAYYFTVQHFAFVHQIGKISLPDNFPDDFEQKDIDLSEVNCPDENTSQNILKLIEQTRLSGDTLGGTIQCILKNIPAGIGQPVFGKLQAQLAHAMLSINTVKAFEYGDGIRSASQFGSEHNDKFILKDNRIVTDTNHDGGIQGGISTGMDISFKVYFKPLSGIQQTQASINAQKEFVSLEVGGRHDVCAVPRAVPIVKAYTHIILTDLFLQNKLTNI